MEQVATIESSNAGGSKHPETWHIVTCEYPPQSGGVSDYAYLLVNGLASLGDQVHVWCPVWTPEDPGTPGVEVHATLGSFSPRDLRRTGRELDRFPGSRRLFLQWVPHGFGYKAINLPFCLWIWDRTARRGDVLDLMVHEPFIGFKKTSWRQSAAAVVQRLMMAILLRTAQRVWVSTPTWEKYLRPFECGRRHTYRWLPLPSNVPALNDPGEVSKVHELYAPGGLLIGHFGTFGDSITPLLRASIPPILRSRSNASVLLIGPGGEAFRDTIVQEHADLGARVHAVGPMNARDPRLSFHLRACDLMIQPYPDGVTSRRTTMMAALAHGRPIVSTSGFLTEPFWESSDAVEIIPAGANEEFVEAVLRLLDNSRLRAALGKQALDFYRREFDIPCVVNRLREAR